MLTWLLREGFTAGQIALLAVGPSERSCYPLIASDRAAGGTLHRHLRRGRRPRRRACRGRRGPIPERRDISERPAAANERSEFGHKEGDLIEGLDSKSFLLALRERKSRFCRILKLPDKCSDTVANALIMLLRPFRASFRSLTLDNCGEFADHVRVAPELGRPDSVCFAWFHRASGKGSVEQLNGLIRRRFLKRIDFRTVPSTALDDLSDHLNVCPFTSPADGLPSTSSMFPATNSISNKPLTAFKQCGGRGRGEGGLRSPPAPLPKSLFSSIPQSSNQPPLHLLWRPANEVEAVSFIVIVITTNSVIKFILVISIIVT